MGARNRHLATRQRGDHAKFTLDRVSRRQKLTRRLAAQNISTVERLHEIGGVRLPAGKLAHVDGTGKSCDVRGHPRLQPNGIDRMRRGLAQPRSWTIHAADSAKGWLELLMPQMRLRPRRCIARSHDAMPPMPDRPPHLEDRYPRRDARAEFPRSPTLQSFPEDRWPTSTEKNPGRSR